MKKIKIEVIAVGAITLALVLAKLFGLIHIAWIWTAYPALGFITVDITLKIMSKK